MPSHGDADDAAAEAASALLAQGSVLHRVWRRALLLAWLNFFAIQSFMVRFAVSFLSKFSGFIHSVFLVFRRLAMRVVFTFRKRQYSQCKLRFLN